MPKFHTKKARPKQECPVKRQLVDKHNLSYYLDTLIKKVGDASYIGIDLETTNRYAHEGILRIESKKTIFDIRRTVITGFSIYAANDDTAYYFNLAHADVENRLPWDAVKPILLAKKPWSYWIAHNAAFEIVMFQMCVGFKLTNILCTLQLAVTAYNPDTYSKGAFYRANLENFKPILMDVVRAFQHYRLHDPLTADQEELFYKVVAKESKAEHSYNGFVKNLSYGYSLKAAVRSHAGYYMETYEELLSQFGVTRMDELTGEQTAEYGADDSYWAVWLFNYLIQYLSKENPPAITTYFNQENPMVEVFAEVTMGGLRVIKDNIESQRTRERMKAAELLREMKSALHEVLGLYGFDEQPYDKLYKYDSWYAKNYQEYRKKVLDFINSPDYFYEGCEDINLAFRQCYQVRSPTGNEWAKELGKSEPSGLNLTHYMPMRTILYDLCRFSFQLHDGKTQSDDEARIVMASRYAKAWAEARGLDLREVYDVEKREITSKELLADPKIRVLMAYKELAHQDTRMKLYLNPYLLMTDPETNRMYPTLKSLLATRRTACENPKQHWALAA